MTKNNKTEESVRYEVITQQDQETGDVIIPLPMPLLKKLGWKDGDDVLVDIDDDGNLFLKKADS